MAPSLFALALLVIKQPDIAGFAVFGTFVQLVMTNYDSSARARSGEFAMLSFLGAIAIGLATLASADVWLAAGGALVAGFLSECPWLARGRWVRDRTALLLAFMLGVAAPASVSAVYPRLAGWLLAGLAAQPILLLLWVPIQPTKTASAIGAPRTEPGSTGLDAASSWIGNAAATGAAMAIAVLLTRLLKLDHAFWVFLGVLPVICARGSSPTRTFWEQQVGTLAGCLIGAFLVAIIGTRDAWYWAILPVDRLCCGLCLERRRFHDRASGVHRICGGSILHPAAASGRRRNPSGRRYRDWRRGELGRSLTPTCGGDQTALKTKQPPQNLAAHAMSAAPKRRPLRPTVERCQRSRFGARRAVVERPQLRAADGAGGGFD